MIGDKLSERFLYENVNSINLADEADSREDNGIPKESENYDEVQALQNGSETKLLPGLINSVPVNQRQAVSAILRQRQAQRIRSKSMVHHNLNVRKEGKTFL